MASHPIDAAERGSTGARTWPLRPLHTRDERLAQLVAEGDEQAFAALYQRHAQTLYRYCRSIVGNDADAQDALQTTFASALVALRAARRDAPLRPWLFRIAHNESITLLRRRRPTVELSQVAEVAGPSAADLALGRDRLDLLVRDLRELGDRQRGALVMRELSGLSHEEIAVALAVSTGAAKQAIFEARQALVEFEEGRAMSCESIRRVISDGDRRMLRGRRVRSHLRACSSCSEFAAGIGRRRADLQALAPPLAPAALAGVLGHVAATGGSGHGASGVAALASGGAGKSAVAVLAAKAVVGAVIVTGAAVGVGAALHAGDHSQAPLPKGVNHSRVTTRPTAGVPATRGPASAGAHAHAPDARGATPTRQSPAPAALSIAGASGQSQTAVKPDNGVGAPAGGVRAHGHGRRVVRGRSHVIAPKPRRSAARTSPEHPPGPAGATHSKQGSAEAPGKQPAHQPSLHAGSGANAPASNESGTTSP